MSNKILGIGIILSLIFACEKKDESDPKNSQTGPATSAKKDTAGSDKKTDSDNGGGPGSLAIGGTLADDLGRTNANILVVKENLAPPPIGALAVGSGSPPLQLLNSQSKAEEIRTRIKGTIEGTMRALDWIHGTINMIEPQLREQQDKTEGTIDLGYMTIEYKFEDAHKYKILTLGGEGGDYHITVDGDHYVLKRRPSKNETQHPGINFVDITYQDENNWTVKDNNTTDQCLSRPKVISSYVEKKGADWAGKMMYWGGNLGGPCADVPAENAVDFSYYEFIGDEGLTTAAGYEYIPVGLLDLSTLSTYGFADDTLATINPVCISGQNLVSPLTPCASSNVAISTPTYGLESQWLLPGNLAKIFNVFPDKI